MAPKTLAADAAKALEAALPPGHGLRERTPQDLPFLRDLYAHVREEELRPVPWPAATKLAFLHDQFERQHAHYLAHYPQACWWVLTHEGEPIGRLYVEQTPRDMRVMDISLLAAHRNRGLGGALMRALIERADRAGVPVTLHVEPFNPALRLYQRLGYSVRGPYGGYPDDPLSVFMEKAA